MAGKTVVVGCKLPQGLIIHHPMEPERTVELRGINKATIIGADHATTEVDAEFFEQWAAVHKEFPAVKSGAIFVAKNAADVAAIARENKARKTGFERMKTDGKDDRAAGVKTVEKDE
jgi:hypothetical protein